MTRQMRNRTAVLVLTLLPVLGGLGAAQDTVTYVHGDAIGSVRVLTNASGQVVQQYDYMPFGEEPNPPAGSTNVRRFGGKERDTATGFDYFGARYHSAQIGRFTSVDPLLNLERAIPDPQRWNRYAYTLNNPLKFTDPDGRDPLVIGGVIGAGVYTLWNTYVNLQQGRPWYQNVGLEASKGLIVGVTLGLAGPVLAAPAAETGFVVASAAAASASGPVGRAQLLQNAVAAGRGGLSEAGRALQSHSGRPGSWLEGTARAGDAAANTAAARTALQTILRTGEMTQTTHKAWGEIVRVRLPDGRGAVWTQSGKFITFLERYRVE